MSLNFCFCENEIHNGDSIIALLWGLNEFAPASPLVHSVSSFTGYPLGFYCKPYSVPGEDEQQMNTVMIQTDTLIPEVLWDTQ